MCLTLAIIPVSFDILFVDHDPRKFVSVICSIF